MFENTAKILNQFSKFMTWKTCNPETKILYQTGSFNKFKEICLLNHFKSKLILNFISTSFVIWFFGRFKKKIHGKDNYVERHVVSSSVIESKIQLIGNSWSLPILEFMNNHNWTNRISICTYKSFHDHIIQTSPSVLNAIQTQST